MNRFYTVVLLLTLSGFLTNSYSQWQQHIIVPNIDWPAIFDFGDIDGDGDLDLGTTSWGDGKILWYRNNSPDTAWTPFLVDNTMSGPVGMVVVDVNGDDTLDLVSTAGSYTDDVVWYENKGGTPIIWEKWIIDSDLDGAETVDVADLDDDGDMDVLACGRQDNLVLWYENDGSTPINWTEHIIDNTLFYPITCLFAYINNDNFLDVVACGGTIGEVVWYENSGGITITWTRHTIDINGADGTFTVDVGDLNGDDYLDVAVTGRDQNNVYWCENNLPDPNWTKHLIDNNVEWACVVDITDVDLDSDLDLMVSGRDENAVVWYQNNLPNSWTRNDIDSSFTQANGVWAYDIDGDADPDAVAGAWLETGKIVWYENPIINSNALIPDFQVNENPGPQDEDQGHSCISIDSSGNFVIAWVDERDGDPDIFAQLYASNGSPIGTNFKVNDQGSVDNWYISISTGGNGNFVITWADFRNGDADIYAQRYSSDGIPLGTNFRVNDDLGGAEQGSPSISIDGNGNFVITWDDLRNDEYQDIYAQRYSSDGSALGTNFLVNDQGSMWQVVPSISKESSGNFVITWEDWRSGDADIYAQRYGSDGSTLGNNFQVDDVQGFARFPSISTDSSGNFVITWTDFRNGNVDIYAQRYSSDGSALGTNFRVDDDPGSEEQETSSISVDDGGNFVITWMDSRNGDYGDIYAQRYSSDGSALGTNFRVTNTSQEDQYDSDVKLWNNRIYNTWTDHRAGITKSDIWANVLDWNNPVTGIDKNELNLIPQEFNLSQNYPNPFNPTTKIRYSVPQFSKVVIKVFDVLGREIETLVNEEKPMGTYELTWYVKGLSSGVYFYRVQAGEFVETKKMILMK